MALLVGGASYQSLIAATADAGPGASWWVGRSENGNDPGRITATWTDPDGVVYPLTAPWVDGGRGYFTMDGPAAWGSAPIELVTDPYSRGGEVVRFIRAQSRRLQWPLYVGGDTHLQFVKNYRTIMKAFTKTTFCRAPGVLEIRRPNNDSRRIQAFYEQGFEGEAGENWLWAKPTIQLFCPDPYWYGAEPKTFTRGANSTPGVDNASFYAPFINIGISEHFDNSVAGLDIVNDGDVETWPTWTVVGPINGFTATNTTTGQRFTFDYDVPEGVTVTITTNPATVRSSTGQNLSRYIDWFNPVGTSLWPLVPGRNAISTEPMAPLAGSSVTLQFVPRYETA